METPTAIPYQIIKSILKADTEEVLSYSVTKTFNNKEEALQYLSKLTERAKKRVYIDVLGKSKTRLKTTSSNPDHWLLFHIQRVGNNAQRKEKKTA